MDPQLTLLASISSDVLATMDEIHAIEALRNGDEATFTWLVRQHHSAMLRLAFIYVTDDTVAEDVVQETWMAVLQGIHRFEARSSLKTWIYRILTNHAKTRAQREGRSVPFSMLEDPDVEQDEPAVAPERFGPNGHWLTFPKDWDDTPESRLLSQETRAVIQKTIDMLPPHQREVITLRDIEGWRSQEVCNVLAISETNQRVLLHRARAKVQQALEHYLAE